MLIDAMSLLAGPATAAADARAAEDRGYDGWFAAETAHDVFLATALGATATSGVTVGTGIAVAFARTPMDVAYSANDLQPVSGGRFVLGLGSQVKPHVEKRFGATWSRPAARMREFVLALRAIWSAWGTGERLDVRGDFYRHTLMTPFFSPGPNPHGPPPVVVAAVGPRMTQVAGEVADGVLCHAFTTERYFREVTLPHLATGAARAGRPATDVSVGLGVFVVSGYDAAERERVTAGVRSQIAFYASTPAYRPVLRTHGWEQLHDELHGLARQGGWAELGERIDDEVLEKFAIVAEPQDVGRRLVERFGDAVDRVSLYADFGFRDDDWADLLVTLRDRPSGHPGSAPAVL
jgi:probable F420-dependent oxidoreductase